MLASIFLVFVGGWALWFWLDKPPAGPLGLPPAGDSMMAHFQRAMDLLKAGYPDMAYVYIWHAHYLVLSVVFGVLLAAMLRALSAQLAVYRRRRRYHPPAGAESSRAGSVHAPPRPARATIDEQPPAENPSSKQAEQ